MRGSVENETLAPKGGTEAAQHVMTFEQQHLHAARGQQIGAEQPADSRPYDNRIVFLRIIPAENSEVPRHSRKPPVDIPYLARYIGGLIAGEIKDEPGHVECRARLSQRNLRV